MATKNLNHLQADQNKTGHFPRVSGPKIQKSWNPSRQLPRQHEARAKGRGHVEKPQWQPDLKARVLQKIRPDANKMLAHMGKPLDYWDL